MLPCGKLQQRDEEDLMATHPFKIVLDEKLAEIDFKDLEGCTEPEIEIIRQAQNAACLPEVYRQLMLTVGKKGIDDLLVGSANYHIVQRFKSTFDDYFVDPLLYPPDSFFFWKDGQGSSFYFFRTQPCVDDPAVYGWLGKRCFHKLAETFSEFILEFISEFIICWQNDDFERLNDLFFRYLAQPKLRYDQQQNDFIELSAASDSDDDTEF